LPKQGCGDPERIHGCDYSHTIGLRQPVLSDSLSLRLRTLCESAQECISPCPRSRCGRCESADYLEWLHNDLCRETHTMMLAPSLLLVVQLVSALRPRKSPRLEEVGIRNYAIVGSAPKQARALLEGSRGLQGRAWRDCRSSPGKVAGPCCACASK
jgi:hypothetical protein